MTVILGIDPGLTHTGWGIVASNDSRISYIKSGVISPDSKMLLSERLSYIHNELQRIINCYSPNTCAMEESFVNQNAATSLKLGCARGAIMLSLSIAGLLVEEYAARVIKKSVTGSGKAEKTQIGLMVKYLLPNAVVTSKDEADALAVALCHSSYMRSKLHDRKINRTY